ncbi:MAG: GtrA family protein [Alphaproteobacteria bacterium]|nr:GtrA family protein [Alphaproteobacteria bacterium]
MGRPTFYGFRRGLARIEEQVTAVVRFAITGATATMFNLLLLWLLTEKIGIWRVPASALSFALALVFNFALQKGWAFASPLIKDAQTQLLQFVAVNFVNLTLNTAIYAVLVENDLAPSMVAQLIGSAMTAVNSFFWYRWIFARPPLAQATSKRARPSLNSEPVSRIYMP